MLSYTYYTVINVNSVKDVIDANIKSLSLIPTYNNVSGRDMFLLNMFTD